MTLPTEYEDGNSLVMRQAADMGDETLWCVTINGPDDLIAAPSRKVAVQMALTFNNFTSDRFEQSPHPDMPLLWAVPGAWPYDANSHALSLSRPHEYQGLVDAALISTGAK